MVEEANEDNPTAEAKASSTASVDSTKAKSAVKAEIESSKTVDDSSKNSPKYTSELKPTTRSDSRDSKKVKKQLIVPGRGTGRRKEAIARVNLVPGTGKWIVNGKELESYFPNKLHQQLVNDPFKVLDLDGSYDVKARINGGGASGQAGALRLGIARALNEIDPDNNRPVLKKAGFLTRDARVVERKKAGLKKARKAPQFSKR